MKKILLVFSVPIVAAFVWGFIVLEQRTVQALEQAGIPAAFVKDCIWSSFSGGYLKYPSIDRLKEIAEGERAAVVRDIAAFARSYSRTDEFKKNYLQFRDNQKPTMPERPPTMAEKRRQDKEDMTRQLKEMETNMRQAPADQRPIYQQMIEMFKGQIQELDNPDNPMYSAQVEEMNNQMYHWQMEEYRQRLAEWEREYPPHSDAMIKRWLTQFLEESRDVDYNAKLTAGQYGKMVFVNPSYESKSPNWKMCYRAGRDVVQAGRAAAEQWLRELR